MVEVKTKYGTKVLLSYDRYMVVRKSVKVVRWIL